MLEGKRGEGRIYYRKLLDYFRGMQYTTEKYSSR